MTKEKLNPLVALTASALALPGTVGAGQLPDRSAALQYSLYEESSLNENDLFRGAGSAERYEIPVLMAKGVWPVNEKLALTLDVAFEKMSGASPWYMTVEREDRDVDGDGDLESVAVRDASGNYIPKVRMTGATIEDTRTDLSLSALYLTSDDSSISATVGISTEDDYQALSAGLGVALEFNDDHTTVDAGVAVSGDTVEAEDAAIYNDRPQEEKRKSSFSLYGGVTQVLNRVSTIQTGLGVKMLTGYLTDAYKRVDFINIDDQNFTADEDVIQSSLIPHELRPADRTRITWYVKYRYFLQDMNTAFHADYRYYDDNWGVNSHTVDVSWYINNEHGWQFVPSLRLYKQSKADFFQLVYEGEQADYDFYSTDFRLSGYGAVSYRFAVVKMISQWRARLGFEYYDSSDSLALGEGSDHPALLDFRVVNFGVSTKF